MKINILRYLKVLSLKAISILFCLILKEFNSRINLDYGQSLRILNET